MYYSKYPIYQASGEVDYVPYIGLHGKSDDIFRLNYVLTNYLRTGFITSGSKSEDSKSDDRMTV